MFVNTFFDEYRLHWLVSLDFTGKNLDTNIRMKCFKNASYHHFDELATPSSWKQDNFLRFEQMEILKK